MALLIKKDNKFLFIRRSKYKKSLPNIWAFPSGTKEKGEDIYKTAVREAYEELKIKIKVENILAIKELPEFESRLYFIICNIISGKPVINDYKEISEIQWLTLQEFFKKYKDLEIGHGLIFLRHNPEIWANYK